MNQGIEGLWNSNIGVARDRQAKKKRCSSYVPVGRVSSDGAFRASRIFNKLRIINIPISSGSPASTMLFIINKLC